MNSAAFTDAVNRVRTSLFGEALGMFGDD